MTRAYWASKVFDLLDRLERYQEQEMIEDMSESALIVWADKLECELGDAKQW